MTTIPAPRVVDVELDQAWTYLSDIQHGGRLLELVAGVALRGSRHPHPLATTAHFLAAPALGGAEVHVEPLRAGRSASTVHARLVQNGRAMLDTVITAGQLGPAGVPAHLAGHPPHLPPLERCVRSVMPAGQPRNGLLEQLDLRVDPATVGVASDVPEVAGWLRYADGRDVDPLALLCLADALPPVTFALGLPGWVPTLELTVHVRALPAPGWLRTVQRAQLMQDGWLDETSEIWDSEDRLVAQGHQLAAFRG